MNRDFWLLIFIMLQTASNAQVDLPFPTAKPDLYENPEYYPVWEKSYVGLQQEISSHQIQAEFSYYNRFVNYFKALSDDPADLLYIFFDGISYDKDAFCYFYSRNIFTETNKAYYKREMIIMDRTCQSVFSGYNPRLVQQMKTIQERDQRYRKKGQFDAEKQRALDSVNLAEALIIYNKYGYPNRKIVGVEFEEVFFYVILHSDLQTMKTFLPVIAAEKDQKRLVSLYPLLHDRISVLKGLPQHFGTQSRVDENGNVRLANFLGTKEEVNSRRKEYHLKPIE